MFGFFTRRRLLTGSFFVAALAVLRPAAAQDVTITGLPTSYFKGFKTIDGQLYYLLRPKEKTYDMFFLEVYGRDLQQKSSTEIKLERGWYQGDARMVGDNAVLYFFTGKEGMLLTLNAAGQKEKEIHFPASAVYGSLTKVQPISNGDFYLTYPLDKGKDGYVVARYAPDLTTRWQKEYLPEKGKYRVGTLEADAAHVYLVADYSKGDVEVLCLDGATGTEKSRKELQALPTVLRVGLTSLDPAGRLILAGTYHEKEKTAFVTVSTEKPGTPPPGGLFLMAIGSDGNQELMSRIPYTDEQLLGKLNTHSTLQTFTVGEYPAIKMHALLPRPGGGFALLGETYKVFGFTDTQYDAAGGVRSSGTVGTAGPGPERREILDFVELELTPQGKLEKLRRIPKPFKVYLDGAMGGGGGPDFHSKTAFAYRFLYQRDPAQLPEAVFLNWHQNLLYVNSLKPSKDVRDNIFTRRYLDQAAAPAGPDRGEFTTRSVPDQVTNPAPLELVYDEIFPHAPGKFVYSHFDPAKSTLRLQVLDIPGQ